MLGSKETLLCMIRERGLRDEYEVGAGFCQRKGAVFRDEAVERISGSSGLT